LLESSHLYEKAQRDFETHGIKTGKLSLNLKTMLSRKDDTVKALTQGVEGLFKKNEVTRYHGEARLQGPGKVVVRGEDGETELEAKHVIIATGSRPAGLEGVEVDGTRIGTSSDALSYPSVPKRMVVIGAGYIGLELGSVWRRLGAEVTVLEYLDRILPGMDSEIAKEAQRQFKKQGLKFKLGTRVTGGHKKSGKAVIECEGMDPIEADRALLAVGRVPVTEGLGLEEAGVELDDKGRIKVDDEFRTSVEGVYAIGDVIEGPMLAHKAEEEGVACVEKIVTGYGHVSYRAIPAIVYTDPEIASVGRTEDELKEDGTEYRKGAFFFMGNGRAKALGETAGKVKLLADAKTDRLLGAHIIGPRAGDLIAELAVAIEFGASAEDVARSVHAHPTLAEAVKEAALAVHSRAIHR
jgi:dihydrolipoamide dehydrogenase